MRRPAAPALLLAFAASAVQCSPLSPHEIIAPAPTAPASASGAAVDLGRYDSDAALPAHAADVVDYALTASLDAVAHTVHGEGTIVWRNLSDAPVSDLWVHLYLNAFKNQRSAFLRENAGGRGSATPTDWGAIDVRRFALRAATGPVDLWPKAEIHRPGDEDETDARVPLPEPVPPGSSVTIEVAWDDKLPNVVARTGYAGSFHMVAQWFPKIARLEKDGTWAHYPFHHLAEFYADYGTYDVVLDVPERYIVGGTGSVVEARDEHGRHFERRVQGDVHDFAWTAWDRWGRLSDHVDGVDVTVLYPPGFRVVAERDLQAARFSIPYFNERYGRYPYPVLTIAHPPEVAGEAGGMEYPTFITSEGAWWMPPGILWPELTVVHEYGHQYFYGLMGTDEARWPFLDEGVNSYAEEQALEAWLGPASAAEAFGLSVSDSSVQAALGNAAAHNAPVAQASYAFADGSDYGALVYQRTAAILETFRRVYGDEPVKRALGRYARRYRFEHPTPDDLLAVFEDALGKDAARSLRVALFEKGWVDYEARAVNSHRATKAAGLFDRGGARETVAAGALAGDVDGWILVTRRGTLAFPVDVELTLDDGSVQRVRWDGVAESARLPYRGHVGIRAAVIDPDHAVTLDEDLTNNHVAAPGPSVGRATRVLERATYWAELALQVLGP